MSQLFRDQCRDAIDHEGLPGLAKLAARTGADLASTVIREHWRHLRKTNLMSGFDFKAMSPKLQRPIALALLLAALSMVVVAVMPVGNSNSSFTMSMETAAVRLSPAQQRAMIQKQLDQMAAATNQMSRFRSVRQEGEEPRGVRAMTTQAMDSLRKDVEARLAKEKGAVDLEYQNWRGLSHEEILQAITEADCSYLSTHPRKAGDTDPRHIRLNVVQPAPPIRGSLAAEPRLLAPLLAILATAGGFLWGRSSVRKGPPKSPGQDASGGAAVCEPARE